MSFNLTAWSGHVSAEGGGGGRLTARRTIGEKVNATDTEMWAGPAGFERIQVIAREDGAVTFVSINGAMARRADDGSILMDAASPNEIAWGELWRFSDGSYGWRMGLDGVGWRWLAALDDELHTLAVRADGPDYEPDLVGAWERFPLTHLEKGGADQTPAGRVDGWTFRSGAGFRRAA